MEKNSVKHIYELCIIAGSAGSLDVLLQTIPKLYSLKVPLLILLHRKEDSTLVKLLSGKSNLPVMETEEKELFMPGHIYVASADYHLLIEKNNTFSFDYSEKVNFSRPSIDVTFIAAADALKDKLVCILLSGANSDGVKGLKYVKQSGGLICVQDPEEAAVSFMPQQAMLNTAVDFKLKTHEIAGFISKLNTHLS